VDDIYPTPLHPTSRYDRTQEIAAQDCDGHEPLVGSNSQQADGTTMFKNDFVNAWMTALELAQCGVKR
jgi:hypothetical protein